MFIQNPDPSVFSEILFCISMHRNTVLGVLGDSVGEQNNIFPLYCSSQYDEQVWKIVIKKNTIHCSNAKDYEVHTFSLAVSIEYYQAHIMTIQPTDFRADAYYDGNFIINQSSKIWV